MEAALAGQSIYFALTGPASPSIVLKLDGEFVQFDLTRNQIKDLQGLIEKAHELNESIRELDKQVYTTLKANELTAQVDSITKRGVKLTGNIGNPGGSLVFGFDNKEVELAPNAYKIDSQSAAAATEIIFANAETLPRLTQTFGDLTNDSKRLEIRFSERKAD